MDGSRGSLVSDQVALAQESKFWCYFEDEARTMTGVAKKVMNNPGYKGWRTYCAANKTMQQRSQCGDAQ